MTLELLSSSRRSTRRTAKVQDADEPEPRKQLSTTKRSSPAARGAAPMPKIGFKTRVSNGVALVARAFQPRSLSTGKGSSRKRMPMVRDPHLTVLENTDSTDEFSASSSDNDMSIDESLDQVSSSSFTAAKGRTKRRESKETTVVMEADDSATAAKRSRRSSSAKNNKQVRNNNLDHETHHSRRGVVTFANLEQGRPRSTRRNNANNNPMRRDSDSEYRSWVLWTKACQQEEDK